MENFPLSFLFPFDVEVQVTNSTLDFQKCTHSASFGLSFIYKKKEKKTFRTVSTLIADDEGNDHFNGPQGKFLGMLLFAAIFHSPISCIFYCDLQFTK